VERHYIGGVYDVLRHPPSNVPIPTSRALICLYWAHGAIMFPFVNKIQLRSLQQIRSVLHFNDNETIPLNDDALHKVRPLVNIVKVTLRAFIQVGSELALEKASVASRSSLFPALIFFNPMKNCGKFNFRLYLLCCATTYTYVRMKVATKNNSNIPDPHESMVTIYNMSLLSKLNKLVMEMCKPLFGSKRIMNMDNFYTSPAVLIVDDDQPPHAAVNQHLPPSLVFWVQRQTQFLPFQAPPLIPRPQIGEHQSRQ
jgi:hypothetical protein